MTSKRRAYCAQKNKLVADRLGFLRLSEGKNTPKMIAVGGSWCTNKKEDKLSG